MYNSNVCGYMYLSWETRKRDVTSASFRAVSCGKMEEMMMMILMMMKDATSVLPNQRQTL